MNFVRKSIAILAIAVLGLLAACGDKPAPNPVPQKVSVPMPTAEEMGLRAKAEITSIAQANARKYHLRDGKGCDPATAAPSELLNSKSYKDFPITGPGIYKAACTAEIKLMAKERWQADADAVARAKAKEAKLAAKRAKAAEIAQKTAKQKHMSSMQPVRPQAVKPVAKTDRRS